MKFLQDLGRHKSQLNPVTLSFYDKSLNRLYSADHINKSLSVSRLSLMLAIMIFALFAIVDKHIISLGNSGQVMQLRITAIVIFISAILLSYNPIVKRYYQAFMVTVVMFGGTILILRVIISEPSGGNFYYVSIILATIYAHSLVRLRFIVASFTTWTVIAAYIIAADVVLKTPETILFNNILFLCSANFLGMFASYGIEYYMRMTFLKNLMLEEKTNLLETEYRRKSKELEDARQLQLSMIPKEIPAHPLYDIAFIMKPASEIGGDFYDLIQHDDGTITFAIGDATGHGAKAGAMVTAMKILFSTYAEKMDIVDFLKKSDQILKKLKLPRLYMSFTIGRISGDNLEVAGVGMPAVTMYSSLACKTCKLTLKGFPLGSSNDFPYRKHSTVLQENDVLLIMTDGLPELFNDKLETIGYEKIEKEFYDASELPSQKIIDRLMSIAGEWMGSHPQQDDMTLLVIKRKSLHLHDKQPVHSANIGDRNKRIRINSPVLDKYGEKQESGNSI